MSEITILHLADIHFKKKKADENKAFRQDVQQKLVDAIKAHTEEHGTPGVVAENNLLPSDFFPQGLKLIR
ncbi:MAG: hypothetical protein GTO45_03185 [Candidatus Aminicenantes bacterium]|nr:hypothetical protein [Candidatus Aminicenantes bacterium]NIM77730.1 hypothetical protein [Candidatus Aminicenantes bacterium]NIN17043.1 hypothetical protein [Candidatus Aminicenantes bacterium]NIN40936.1 hypothetical protein [Candidatus Aminicenantes bacterium]NIN83741.1 hypothetical protein [Candidatus Aminicenantes bacterium]